MPTPLFTHNPNFIERHYGVVSLSVSNRQLDKSTKSIRFAGAKVITTNPVVQSTLFSVPVSGSYRSPTLKRNRKNLVEEVNRGLTRVSYDPDDFAGANFHGEGALGFVKIEELDSAGVEIKESPWLIVPPPDFFSSGRRSLILNGLAPVIATPAGYSGLPPVGALVLKMPKYADAVTITNTDGANPLFVSLGAGHQEYEIDAGNTFTLTEGGVSVLFIRSTGADVPFKSTFAIVNGIEA